MKRLLLPFSWLYGAAVAGRNKAFDRGWLKSDDAGVPVISVGNMTVGGTGKTPLVEFIVSRYIANGRRVAVVSHGYGRSSRGVVVVSDGSRLLVDAVEGGDEPVQIARKFPAAIVVVGEKRVNAARVAVNRCAANLIVLDDGFQHRYLRRGMDIVVIDSAHDLLREPMLPAGFRREELAGLGRATLLAFSKMEKGNVLASKRAQFTTWNSGPAIAYRYRTMAIFKASDHSQVSPGILQGRPVVAFSGIGNHQGFIEGLRRDGIVVAGNLRFPDHHVYREVDLERIVGMMKEVNAEASLTTEKDVVRMMGDRMVVEKFLRVHPIYYPRIEVEFVEGEGVLTSMMDGFLKGNE